MSHAPLNWSRDVSHPLGMSPGASVARDLPGVPSLFFFFVQPSEPVLAVHACNIRHLYFFKRRRVLPRPKLRGEFQERASDEAPGRRDLDGDRVSARVIKAAGASLHAGGDAVPDLSTLNGIY